ncbi:amine oxidase, partial [Blyttiomyces helicus]
IKFQPPLPTWKSQAIDRLEMGLFNKLVLVFPHRFWDKEMDSFGSISGPEGDGDDPYPHFAIYYALNRNMYPTTKLPVLVSFISGEAARDFEAAEDKDIVAKALVVLGRIFPEQQPIPYPIETIVTRHVDEFARGSYSYIAQHATGKDYDTMARPVNGRIFWAGEATCREYPATVHG